MQEPAIKDVLAVLFSVSNMGLACGPMHAEPVEGGRLLLTFKDTKTGALDPRFQVMLGNPDIARRNFGVELLYHMAGSIMESDEIEDAICSEYESWRKKELTPRSLDQIKEIWPHTAGVIDRLSKMEV